MEHRGIFVGSILAAISIGAAAHACAQTEPRGLADFETLTESERVQVLRECKKSSDVWIMLIRTKREFHKEMAKKSQFEWALDRSAAAQLESELNKELDQLLLKGDVLGCAAFHIRLIRYNKIMRGDDKPDPMRGNYTAKQLVADWLYPIQHKDEMDEIARISKERPECRNNKDAQPVKDIEKAGKTKDGGVVRVNEGYLSPEAIACWELMPAGFKAHIERRFE
jgi:hypothetical protein